MQTKDNIAFIGFGSNLNNPIDQITEAFIFLQNDTNINKVQMSSLYLSPPMGSCDQNDYINSVAKVHTNLNYQQLHKLLKTIEKKHKKKVISTWGPRTLDLDLLSYNGIELKSKILTIPHPGIAYRNFVIIPWYEIAPDFVLPNNIKIAKLYQSCDKNIRKIKSIC